MATNEVDAQAYADKVLRLTVRLEVLAKSTDVKVKQILRNLSKELLAILAIDPSNTKKQQAEVRAMLMGITKESYSEIDQVFDDANNVAAAAAVNTEIAAYVLLGEPARVLSKTAVDRLVKTSLSRSMGNVMPDVNPRITVGQMIQRFTTSPVTSIGNYASEAFQQGHSVTRMTADLRKGLGLQSNAAEAISRTMLQAVANEARDEVGVYYGAEKEMWMATLDAWTCGFCASQDGKCEDIGTLPIIPAHPRCRCVKMYIPASVGCQGMKDDLTRVERDDNGKSVHTDKYLNYGTWIKTQSNAVQDEFLGKTRAKLLRDGDVSYPKLFTQDGNFKALDNL